MIWITYCTNLQLQWLHNEIQWGAATLDVICLPLFFHIAKKKHWLTSCFLFLSDIIRLLGTPTALCGQCHLEMEKMRSMDLLLQRHFTCTVITMLPWVVFIHHSCILFILLKNCENSHIRVICATLHYDTASHPVLKNWVQKPVLPGIRFFYSGSYRGETYCSADQNIHSTIP